MTVKINIKTSIKDTIYYWLASVNENEIKKAMTEGNLFKIPCKVQKEDIQPNIAKMHIEKVIELGIIKGYSYTKEDDYLSLIEPIDTKDMFYELVEKMMPIRVSSEIKEKYSKDLLINELLDLFDIAEYLESVDKMSSYNEITAEQLIFKYQQIAPSLEYRFLSLMTFFFFYWIILKDDRNDNCNGPKRLHRMVRTFLSENIELRKKYFLHYIKYSEIKIEKYDERLQLLRSCFFEEDYNEVYSNDFKNVIENEKKYYKNTNEVLCCQ